MGKKDKEAPPPQPSLKSRLAPWVLLGATLLVCELAARLVFLSDWRGFEKTRLLMGAKVPPSSTFQNCIAQPYLLYIPAPFFKNEAGEQHNAQGYRGPSVPMRRRPGYARVLCMGGSTTYGWGVGSPEETYPAELARLLNKDLPKGVVGVEVINAGVPSGTTAEILTHYQFKFHYYRPDLVILNPGGNDARALFMPHYHPDYSNTRRQLQLPEPLPPKSRWALESRLLSLFIVPFLHGPYPAAGSFYTYEGRPPPALWYPESPKPQSGGPGGIAVEEVAFKHNLESVLDLIKKDGAKALLVPFRSSPITPYWPQEGVALEERLLQEIARRRNLAYAPFPHEVISRENWLDDCHTNAAGNAQKAAHLLPYARKLLWSR